MLIPLLKGGWDLYSPWGDMDRLEAELNGKSRRGAEPSGPEADRALRPGDDPGRPPPDR
jgi:hypothetical protein